MKGHRKQGLRIGQVAGRAGVGVETLRFYERKGLVPEPPRSESGYRLYPEEAVTRIRFIRRAGELGFSLREVGELLALGAPSEADAAAVRLRAESRIREIEERIADLDRMREALAGLTARCRRAGAGGECPILEALAAGDQRDGGG